MRKGLTAGSCALVLLAACERSTTQSGPILAPSPAARAETAAAAVGASAASVQRASAGLAVRVSGWDRPAAPGSPRQPAPAGLIVDAGAFGATTTPENLPAVARALDGVLRATRPAATPR